MLKTRGLGNTTQSVRFLILSVSDNSLRLGGRGEELGAGEPAGTVLTPKSGEYLPSFRRQLRFRGDQQLSVNVCFIASLMLLDKLKHKWRADAVE